MARLGGIHEEGLFGGVPAFVDRALAPGYSDQTKALSLKSTAGAPSDAVDRRARRRTTSGSTADAMELTQHC